MAGHCFHRGDGELLFRFVTNSLRLSCAFCRLRAANDASACSVILASLHRCCYRKCAVSANRTHTLLWHVMDRDRPQRAANRCLFYPRTLKFKEWCSMTLLPPRWNGPVESPESQDLNSCLEDATNHRREKREKKRGQGGNTVSWKHFVDVLIW